MLDFEDLVQVEEGKQPVIFILLNIKIMIEYIKYF